MTHKCNEMKYDIEELENTCVVTGARCDTKNITTGPYTPGSVFLECKDCGRHPAIYNRDFRGGRRKRKRKTKKRRKKKTKKRRRKKKKKTKRRR